VRQVKRQCVLSIDQGVSPPFLYSVLSTKDDTIGCGHAHHVSRSHGTPSDSSSTLCASEPVVHIREPVEI
jgi:hypothetical protein